MLKKRQRPTKVFVGLLSVAAPWVVVAPVAAADAPTQILEEVSFVDMNPCTGLDHTVAIAIAISGHSYGGRVVAHERRTITTKPTGFVGRGTASFVDNGHVGKSTFTDVLSNSAGERIRARGVRVVDLSTGTIRVDRYELTCLGRA